MRAIILAICLVFVGCAPMNKPFEIETPKLNLPLPDPLTLKKVEFRVVERNMCDGAATFIPPGDPSLLVMSTQDYKNLSLNIQALQNYLQELRRIVILYQQFYETTDK